MNRSRSTSSVKAPSETELVERAQQGDEAAFGQLVTMHYDKVYGQALRMMKSSEEAKDVAQLAWIKAWRKIASYRHQAAFATWIYRITTFTALDAIRSRNSRRESLADQNFLENAAELEASHVASPQQVRSLERRELQDRISQAMDTLPEKLKIALQLREIEGLSYEAIAEQMNCKIGTVMSRLFNARKSIQKQLADLLS